MKFTLIALVVIVLAIIMLAVFAAVDAYTNSDEFMPEKKDE